MNAKTIALLLGLATLAGCRPGGRAPEGAPGNGPERSSLRIGVGGQAQFIYLPLTLGQQLGYFRDAGLRVEIVGLKGGSEALAALAGGSIDVVCGFYEHTIRTQSQGKELVLFTLFDLYPGMVLMVGTRHADDVRTIRDLVGHPVGVTAPGSSTDGMVKYLLKQEGLDPQSIAVVAAGTTTMLAALEQDRIWAGVSVDPLASKIEKDGIGRPLYDTRTESGTRAVFGGAWPAGGLYAPRDFVERNPRTVQALANAGVRTLRFIHAHGAEEVARKMPTDFWAGDFALYAASLGRNLTMFSADGAMPEEGPPSVRRTLELVDPKVLSGRIDLVRTYDNSFVRRVP